VLNVCVIVVVVVAMLGQSAMSTSTQLLREQRDERQLSAVSAEEVLDGRHGPADDQMSAGNVPVVGASARPSTDDVEERCPRGHAARQRSAAIVRE
jgi:hypothetical protein